MGVYITNINSLDDFVNQIIQNQDKYKIETQNNIPYGRTPFLDKLKFDNVKNCIIYAMIYTLSSHAVESECVVLPNEHNERVIYIPNDTLVFVNKRNLGYNYSIESYVDYFKYETYFFQNHQEVFDLLTKIYYD